MNALVHITLAMMTAFASGGRGLSTCDASASLGSGAEVASNVRARDTDGTRYICSAVVWLYVNA